MRREGVGRSGPNLEPKMMRVYVTHGPRSGLDIGRKVGPCLGSRRRWMLGSVHAFFQAVHAANAYRPRFQVRAQPSYSVSWVDLGIHPKTVKENQVTYTNTRHEQYHKRPHEGTPPSLNNGQRWREDGAYQGRWPRRNPSTAGRRLRRPLGSRRRLRPQASRYIPGSSP